MIDYLLVLMLFNSKTSLVFRTHAIQRQIHQVHFLVVAVTYGYELRTFDKIAMNYNSLNETRTHP